MNLSWLVKIAGDKLVAATERINAFLDEVAGDDKAALAGNSSESASFLMNSKDPIPVSPQIVTFADALSEHPDTFLHFPPPDPNSPWQLTPSQEAHAKEVLQQSERLSALRYSLCPKKITDAEFWRVYFTLLQSSRRRHAPSPVSPKTDTGAKFQENKPDEPAHSRMSSHDQLPAIAAKIAQLDYTLDSANIEAVDFEADAVVVDAKAEDTEGAAEIPKTDDFVILSPELRQRTINDSQPSSANQNLEADQLP
jgi:hypothetical protein